MRLSALILSLAAPLVLLPVGAAAQKAALTATNAPAGDFQALLAASESAYQEDRSGDFGEAAAAALAMAEARYGADEPRTARALTYVGIWHLVLSRHVEAEQVLRRALEIFDAHGGRDSIEAAAAMNYLAEARLMQGDYGEGDALLAAALPVARARGGDGHADTVRIALTYGYLCLQTNRQTEGDAVMVPILAAGRATLGSRHRQVIQLAGMVASLRGLQGRSDESVAEYRRALAASEAGLGADHGTTVSVMANLASVLTERGELAEAETLIRRVLALAAARRGDDHGEVLGYRLQLATLLSGRGDLAGAERTARDVLETIERRYSGDHPQLVGALEFLAHIYSLQGRLDEALPMQERAVATRLRVEGASAATTLGSQGLLATFYDTSGRTADAEALYRMIVDALGAALGADNPATLSAAIRLADFYGIHARYDEADAILVAQLPVAERVFGPTHIWTLHARYHRARNRWAAGDLEAAHAGLTDVYRTTLQTHGRTHPQTVFYASALAYLRLDMPAQHAAALEPAALVAEALNRRRAGLAGATDPLASGQAEQVLRFGAKDLTLYADALWVSQTDKNRSTNILEAFAALQNATSGGADLAVLRTAGRRVAERRDSALGALVREREGLEEAWANNTTATSATLAQSGPDAETSRAALRADRQRIDARLAEIDAILRQRFPQYFALIQPEPVAHADIQGVLGDDEAVLMVVPTDYGTNVMALSSTSGSWVRTALTREQADWSVRRLLYDLGATVDVSMEEVARWQEEAGGGYPFDRQTAFSLYTHFVRSVDSVLAGKRHIFIVTSGSLTGLPFGVLVTEEPQGRDGDPVALRATPWLADRHALVRIPTLQSLWLQRTYLSTEGSNRGTGFIGYGDPLLDGVAAARSGGRGTVRGSGGSVAAVVGEGATIDGTRLADIAALKRMARLPGTAIELENMRRALGAPAASVRLGGAATESAIRTADLSGARILALATHGLMAGEIDSAFEPGLVFTPPSQASPSDDGLLTASEVATLDLDADWVVLSACNTAAGDGSAGAPGLSGLAQAFFFAGARTLLASHWPVRDDVASRMIVRIIEIQRDNPALSRAEAFQQAMREIRNDVGHDSTIDSWAHPNAWAPFSLIGDGAR